MEQSVDLAELAYSNAECAEWTVVVLVDGLYTVTAEAEVATKVDPEVGLEQAVEVHSMPVAVIW